MCWFPVDTGGKAAIRFSINWGVEKGDLAVILDLHGETDWSLLSLAESVAIVTLNLCTVIVFIKNRNLRKRSTYLLINLAVKDMLAGGIAVHKVFYSVGADCNVWKSDLIGSRDFDILAALRSLFPITGFYMTSLKFEIQNYWSSWDFT